MVCDGLEDDSRSYSYTSPQLSAAAPSSRCHADDMRVSIESKPLTTPQTCHKPDRNATIPPSFSLTPPKCKTNTTRQIDENHHPLIFSVCGNFQYSDKLPAGSPV